eukprot:snap_masked-scaffold_70-processed-gene-0.73-mRNA-1 protein AED:1.00 eAED:1.00 QI:0/-1/0/0/-1/1/1/0/219
MGNTLQELYDNTSRFLQQIKRKNLKLNLEKCELMSNRLKFYGREVDKDGWKFYSCYAKGLLDRVKPVYLHEFAQLFYTASFISASMPGFSRIRKLLLGSNKVTGKLKNLERMKLVVDWTEEMNKSYDHMIEAIKESMTHSLGYCEPEEDVYLFTDACDKFYSLFITQTAEKVDRINPSLSNFRVIAMGSGSLGGSSLNWHISSKELFPVLISAKKFYIT